LTLPLPRSATAEGSIIADRTHHRKPAARPGLPPRVRFARSGFCHRPV